MTQKKKSAPEDISAKLHDAIDGLRKDVTRVEIWATALSSFSLPVPDYQPDPKFQLGQPVETGPLGGDETGSRAANDDRDAARDEREKPSE